MSYWHQDDAGRWRFDWSHLAPVLPLALLAVVAVARRLWGGCP